MSIFTTLFICWIGHLFVDVMIGFWSIYKTIAQLDFAIAGMIAGLCPFIGEGMQIIFGSLGDKGHRKKLLLLGLLAVGTSVFFPYTQNIALYFLIYLITCLGSGAFHPAAVAMTSRLTVHNKGLFVTIFASGGAIGFAFSHVIFTYWYTHWNGNTVYLALPILCLVLVILLKKLPEIATMPVHSSKGFDFASLKRLFRSRQLRVLYTAQVCNQAMYWTIVFFLPDLLIVKGYELWVSFGIGTLFFVMGGAIILIPSGYLSDKYPAKFVLLTASSLGCVLYYIFLASPLLPNSLLLLLLFALGATLGVANPVAVALGQRIMPDRPGLVSAFLMGLVWCIAEGLGPGCTGLLTKLFADNALLKAMQLFGMFSFIGIVMTLLLPRSSESELKYV